MGSQEDKRKTVDRYLRQADKHVGHEEQKRRQGASRARRAARNDSGRGRRTRGFDEDDDELEFEKITRVAHGATGSAGSAGSRGATSSHYVSDDDARPRSTIVAVHRGRVVLEDEREARLAGRLAADPDLSLVVGDEVAYSEQDGVARVEALVPRRNRLARTDPGNPNRELAIAANLDLAVVVAAAIDPPLRPGLIDRYLLALERGEVPAAVCINKLDLIDTGAARAELEAVLAPYEELGVPVFRVSADAGRGLDALREAVRGRTCVFVGHSGVGKSSLLNALDPEGQRATGAVRERRGGEGPDRRAGRGGGRGRHTTTSSSLRDLGDGTRVIDTPGVRAFALEELSPDEALAGFPDLAAFAHDCRYSNCRHLDDAADAGCGLRRAVEEGRAPAARYDSFTRIVAGD